MPDILIPSLDGASFEAYSALPKGGNGPGLIVIHGIFGCNVDARRECDTFAALGYTAVCPNLFWKQKVGAQTNATGTTDWEQASKFYKNFDVEAGTRDLLATLACLRQMPGCNGKVGAIGFCLGSRMAFLMAARSDLDCVVSYGGVGFDSMLDEIHDIRAPYLLHLPEQDRFVPASMRQRIMGAMARNRVVVTYSYPGAEHGFSQEGDAHFNPEIAALARTRTQEFLAAYLMDSIN